MRAYDRSVPPCTGFARDRGACIRGWSSNCHTVMRTLEKRQSGKESWKARSLRSGFGVQCLASKPSSPAAGFGSSNRDAYVKVNLHQEQLIDAAEQYTNSFHTQWQYCWRRDSSTAAAGERGPPLNVPYHGTRSKSSCCQTCTEQGCMSYSSIRPNLSEWHPKGAVHHQQASLDHPYTEHASLDF